MRNFQTKLILILLQVVSVLTAGNSNDVTSSSNVQPTNPILPLVLIDFQANYVIRPIMITNISKNINGQLLGGTSFSNSLQPFRKQFYACSMGTWKITYSPYSGEHDDENCSYWTSFENTEPLTCRFEPVPFVEKVNVANDPKNQRVYLPCGPRKRGKMYRFVYKVCLMDVSISNSSVLKLDFTRLMVKPINQRDSFEIYRFCYNEDDKEVIFTTYKITSAELLRDDNLSNERSKTYPMISDGYKYFGKYYEEIEQDYKLLENYQRGLTDEERSSKPLYRMQKLLPENFMEFALWKKPLYHFLNARLMESKQAELWNYINLLIQLDATQNRRNYGIRTAVFTLDANRTRKPPLVGKIYLPDFWLEVIDYEYLLPSGDNVGYDGVAVIMNTNHGNSVADAYFNDICKKNWCNESISEVYPEQVTETVRCCPVTDEILKIFNSTQPIHNVLKIDLLTDEN